MKKIQTIQYKEHAQKKYYKIGNTSNDIKTLLIECLDNKNYRFIKQYAKSLDVTFETIIKYINKWKFDRRLTVSYNDGIDIVEFPENKDLSFTERLQLALNYSNNYFEFSDNNTNLAE